MSNGELTKILILVKTYPTISEKYIELVCTAGITEDGEWIRIYPIQFRLLEFVKKYKKYQWVEARIVKNKSDPRPESYRIIDFDSIKLLNTIDTKNEWKERKDLLFSNIKIYNNLNEIIEKANNNEFSLALFKPKEIKDFIVKETDREWDKEKVRKVERNMKQQDLFTTEEEAQIKDTFQLTKKIPYQFYYKFLDESGKESQLMIEDWELGQLYWNCLKRANNNEEIALEKVKMKYFDVFKKKDLYLFLGTTREFHGWAKNPFIIIGVFYPPL